MKKVFCFLLSIVYCLLFTVSQSQTWSPVSSGLGSPGGVFAMAVYNNELYVSGNFGSAGGVPAITIARWNGIQWDSVGLGIEPNYGGYINSMCIVNGELYAGGTFIAGMYNGQPWPNSSIPGTKNL